MLVFTDWEKYGVPMSQLLAQGKVMLDKIPMESPFHFLVEKEISSFTDVIADSGNMEIAKRQKTLASHITEIGGLTRDVLAKWMAFDGETFKDYEKHAENSGLVKLKWSQIVSCQSRMNED